MNALVPITAAPAFTVSDVEKVATAIAKGGLFGSKDPYAVLTLCLLAQAEGQHPAVVFRDYHIISGKPAKKADAMLRDFIGAGGKVEWHTLNDDLAEATFSHAAGGSARISWDHPRAVKAQLAGNAMYKKYPRQMLRSRTISEGVRTIYPAATSGLYVPEEVSTFEPTTAPVDQELIEHNPQTGETEQPQDEPAAREKLEGKHSSKTALGTALRAFGMKVGLAYSVRELDAIEAEYADDLNQGKRYLPKWFSGDPEKDSKGFTRLLSERRAFLELLDEMRANRTSQALSQWLGANSDKIEGLGDGEGREFERVLAEFEEALKVAAHATAG